MAHRLFSLLYLNINFNTDFIPEKNIPNIHTKKKSDNTSANGISNILIRNNSITINPIL
jgi:hypothetical protein